MSDSRAKVLFSFWDDNQWHDVEVGLSIYDWEVPIPRIGELVVCPDDVGQFRVEDVVYKYADGLAFPPTINVRFAKP